MLPGGGAFRDRVRCARLAHGNPPPVETSPCTPLCFEGPQRRPHHRRTTRVCESRRLPSPARRQRPREHAREDASQGLLPETPLRESARPHGEGRKAHPTRALGACLGRGGSKDPRCGKKTRGERGEAARELPRVQSEDRAEAEVRGPGLEDSATRGATGSKIFLTFVVPK